MKKITYDLWGHIENPTIVLSTRYHKHLGEITNIFGYNTSFNMNSFQEFSFDLYKVVDGKECKLWDQVVDFKYIYIPEFKEYFEITTSMDETDNTVKHVTAKSASEVELSNRILHDYHFNDETDIDRDDYEPTVIYNPDNPKASLLDRVLHDKYPEWTIKHVDNTIAKIQRTFTANGTTPYQFFTSTVASEIDGLFVFDSVNRTISLYDLDDRCLECKYKGNFIDRCPRCGSTNYTKGYGKNTGIYLSTANYANSISLSGNPDGVKSCFKVSGGDDLITATVANLNPNGSNYIYHFSKDMMSDMPQELVDRINSYEELYASVLPTYTDLTEQWYEKVDEELYLRSGMMPETPIPGDTTAAEQLAILESAYRTGTTVAVSDITKTTNASADSSVKGLSRAIVDPRYTVDIVSSTLSDLDKTTNTRTWTGKFKVTSLGKVDKDGNEDTATSAADVNVIVNGNYEEFLKQKIDKSLDRKDAGLITLFKIEDDEEFKAELKKYCLNRLTSFKDTYQAVLEILIKQQVTTDNAIFYGGKLYEEFYTPYYTRLGYIESEMVVREGELNTIIEEETALEEQRAEIQVQLDLEDYLGTDLFNIFKLYIREQDFGNSNYISEGLDNSEVVAKAQELLDVANDELYKSAELQVTINDNLNNLLGTSEFSNFKEKFEIGDWMLNEIDGKLYKLRLVSMSLNYENQDINVTFSNVLKYRDGTSDVRSILSQAQSMATTYGYTSKQAEQGSEAKTEVDEFRDYGLNAAKYNVLAGDNQTVVIDNHGIVCTEYDDEFERLSSEQLKILNNMIAFTDNNWQDVKTAIGKISYKLDGKEKTTYGVNADTLISGVIISGDIYSLNYSSTDRAGTHFDLMTGDFSIGGGKISFDHSIDTITIEAANINWSGGEVNAPDISEIPDLEEKLDAKQDKLTAGANITIDSNNVISANVIGTCTAIRLSSAEYEALPTSDKLDPTKIYFISNKSHKSSIVGSDGSRLVGSDGSSIIGRN